MRSLEVLILAGAVMTAPATTPDCAPSATRPLPGIVVTDVCGQHDTAAGIAVQQDGGIVVAGTSQTAADAPGRLTLARYTSEGKLDRHFGDTGTGVVEVSLPDMTDFSTADIAIPGGTNADDTTLTVVGTARLSDDRHAIAVARFTQDGQLDRHFGTNGVALHNSGQDDTAAGHAILEDGTVVVAGTTRPAPNKPGKLLLLRYRTDGTLDPHFDEDGVVIREIGADITATGIAILDDGTFVTIGTTRHNPDTPGQLALLRYRADGTPDPNFGETGLAVHQLDGEHAQNDAVAVVVLEDGTFVVAATIRPAPDTPSYWALLRYGSDLRPDTRFGPNGDGVVKGTPADGDAEAATLEFQDDGTVVLIGTTQTDKNAPHSVVISRFTTSGTLDTTGFGGGTGQITVPLPGKRDFTVSSVALNDPQKITIVGTAGTTAESPTQDFTIGRYELDGRPDEGWPQSPGAAEGPGSR